MEIGENVLNGLFDEMNAIRQMVNKVLEQQGESVVSLPQRSIIDEDDLHEKLNTALDCVNNIFTSLDSLKANSSNLKLYLDATKRMQEDVQRKLQVIESNGGHNNSTQSEHLRAVIIKFDSGFDALITDIKLAMFQVAKERDEKANFFTDFNMKWAFMGMALMFVFFLILKFSGV